MRKSVVEIRRFFVLAINIGLANDFMTIASGRRGRGTRSACPARPALPGARSPLWASSRNRGSSGTGPRWSAGRAGGWSRRLPGPPGTRSPRRGCAFPRWDRAGHTAPLSAARDAWPPAPHRSRPRRASAPAETPPRPGGRSS